MSHAHKYHAFVCTQQKLEDRYCCANRGAEDVFQELQRQVQERQLTDQVTLTACSCFGLCKQGPSMVVYPEGIWYQGLSVSDVNQLVQSHFVEGKPLERLQVQDLAALHAQMLEHVARTDSRAHAHEEAGVLPERLRRLATDFQASRAFLSAIELDLFTAIGEGATPSEAAERMGTDPRATEVLLNALTAVGLLRKREHTFFNSADTGRFLRRGLPDDSRAALMNGVHAWDNWSTLSECVREGGALRHDMTIGPSVTQAYIAATHKIATLAAPALVSALRLPKVRRVLDLGGGSGAYTVALLRAYEGSTAEIVDLPPVIHVATRYVREAGLESRITLRPGNFMLDPLGSGFDLVLLSYVMHLSPPEANKRLLAKVFQALAPGGRVVINDYVLNADKTLPRGAALFALNMLVSTQGGSVYSFEEYQQWLGVAGFGPAERVPLLGPTDVVTALKPAQ